MSPDTNCSRGFSTIMPALIEVSIAAFSSSTLPMHLSSLPSLVRQIGIGIPQNLDLERFQSLRFSSQLPNRPVPVLSGFQFIVLFSAIIRSLAAVDFMNQLSKG